MPHITSCAAVGQDAAGAHVLAAAEDLDALCLVCQVLVALSARKQQLSMRTAAAPSE